MAERGGLLRSAFHEVLHTAFREELQHAVWHSAKNEHVHSLRHAILHSSAVWLVVRACCRHAVRHSRYMYISIHFNGTVHTMDACCSSVTAVLKHQYSI